MESLFGSLTHAVEGSALLALAAAMAWGVLSILLSPCHLSSIPLIVGFIGGQQPTTMRRAFSLSTAFALGILISISVIGGVTGAAGRLLGDVGPYGNYVVSVVLFVVGLHLLGIIPAPWSSPGQVGIKRKGLVAAFVLGSVFGIALGPCTFAYMAPMLAVTFRLAASNLAYGVLLLLAFGIGHCGVIVAAGTSTDLVQRYLNWNEQSKGTTVIKTICGVFVLIGGIYLLYIA